MNEWLQEWWNNITKNQPNDTKESSTQMNMLGSLAGTLTSYLGANQDVVGGVNQTISEIPNYISKAKDIIGNTEWNKWGQATKGGFGIAGLAGQALGNFAEDRASLSGEYGKLSQSSENITDVVLSSIPGFGQAYSAINGISDFIAGSMDGASTSGNTKSDAILDAIPGLGIVNSLLGKDMGELKYDTKTWNAVGNSYTGSQNYVQDASDNTGGRYGLVSTITGEYQNDLIQNLEGARQANLVSRIGDEATEAKEKSSSTLSEAMLNQQKRLNGYNYTFKVQKGMKIPNKEDIQKTKNLFKETPFNFTWEYPELTFKYVKGGKSQNKKKNPKTRSLEELIQYAKEQNPRFVQRMTEPLKWLDLPNGEKATHILGWSTDDQNNAIVYPQVMEDQDGNLYDYGEGAFLEADQRGDYLIMAPEEAQIFTEGYKQGWPMFFQQTPSQKFAKGGTMNIIPEGELHARLHHMEQEGITKKGIPVISEEEGGEIIQHAEIERNEIIFRLEVTKKLEELMEDGSEEAALEAGKLLADEILNNTEDRTGLLNEVE